MKSDLLSPGSKVICPCMGVTEDQVLEAIKKGNTTLLALKDELEVATKCTGCEAYLYDILDFTGSTASAPSHRRKKISLKETARKIYHWIKVPRLKMASCFIETPQLHTRINLTNLEFPELPGKTKPVWIEINLLDSNGQLIWNGKKSIPTNETASIEVGEILKTLKTPPQVGQVQIYLRASRIGASRFYAHWYNEDSVTSTHEKESDRPIERGYFTLSKVAITPTYETYVAIGNLTTAPYRSNVILSNHKNEKSVFPLQLPPSGTIFSSVADLFQGAKAHLDGNMGSLYLDNLSQPVMFYYFGYHPRRNAWQVQHI